MSGYRTVEAKVADRCREGLSDLQLHKVPRRLARAVGHGKQPAGGQLGRVTGRSRQPYPSLTLRLGPAPAAARPETLGLTPEGSHPAPRSFAPILQPSGAPPLQSLPQIIELEVCKADTPSESIYLESHKITPGMVIND